MNTEYKINIKKINEDKVGERYIPLFPQPTGITAKL